MLFFALDPAELAGIAVALIVGITFHEFSHAYVADQLGDHRPRALGRVSLNPTHHLDPVGAIVFLIAGFGWGKPVPVNIGALRPGRIGMALVSAAGPLANVIVAVVAAILYRVLDIAGIGGFTLQIVESIVYFNLLLAIFNLIPIPPLDGYNAVLAFLLAAERAPRAALLGLRHHRAPAAGLPAEQPAAAAAGAGAAR